MVDSFWYMAKPIQCCKVKKKKDSKSPGKCRLWWTSLEAGRWLGGRRRWWLSESAPWRRWPEALLPLETGKCWFHPHSSQDSFCLQQMTPRPDCSLLPPWHQHQWWVRTKEPVSKPGWQAPLIFEFCRDQHNLTDPNTAKMWRQGGENENTN